MIVLRMEDLTLMYPVVELRDREERKIPSHVWAHLPQPDLAEPPTRKGQDQRQPELERSEDVEW